MPVEPPGADDVVGHPDLVGPNLVGRAGEAVVIRRMLGAARLVTVTGLPGVGKTAVALAAESSAAGSFADGSLLVRLDTLRDEALLPHTIAAALRLPDEFTRGRLEVLADQYGPPAAAGRRGGVVRPAGGPGRGRDRAVRPGHRGLPVRAAGQAAAGHRAGGGRARPAEPGRVKPAERSVLLTVQPAGQRSGAELRYLLPTTLRAYGRGMLRRLGQDEEFTARHQRWLDGRRPHHGATAGK